MIFVISPAKSLNEKDPIDCQKASEPVFQEYKEPIVEALKKLKSKEIATKFAISSKLADLNYDRFQKLSSVPNRASTRQAIYTFDGDVYTGIDAYTIPKKSLDYAEKHLRILSGLYGVLKPFDLIEPYRLEMGIELKIGRHKNLYSFWKEQIATSLKLELDQMKSDILINLASQEYFKAIDLKKLDAKILQVDFLEEQGDAMKNISFYSKKARGFMARYAIDQKIKKADDLKEFDVERYQFSEKLSSKWHFVYTRKYTRLTK